MLDFDKAKIIERLSAGSPQLSAAFSMACARRLVNSLDGKGDGKASALIAMGFWETIQRGFTEGAGLPSGLEDEIISLIPDEDDESDFVAGVWDDALAALWLAANVFSTSSVESAYHAASRAIDTAFRYSLQSQNDTTLTDSAFRLVMGGTTVQTELARQSRDLDDVARATDAVHTVDLLLSRAAEEAVLPNPVGYRAPSDPQGGSGERA